MKKESSLPRLNRSVLCATLLLKWTRSRKGREKEVVMTETQLLVSELLQQGHIFARDKRILRGPQKDLCTYISSYRSCLDADQFSEGELHSISREIYGLAKTCEKNHPELSCHYPNFFRTLERVCRHVQWKSGGFECMIDGEEVAVMFLGS
jgi:hypothetical protein